MLIIVEFFYNLYVFLFMVIINEVFEVEEYKIVDVIGKIMNKKD